jgi:hypothetical protein
MTSALNSDNPTDNGVLELDDVLEAVCTKVGTNTILLVDRRQDRETYQVQMHSHQYNHPHQVNRFGSLQFQQSMNYPH